MFELTRDELIEMIDGRTTSAEKTINKVDEATKNLVQSGITFKYDNETAERVDEVEAIFNDIRDEFLSDD